MCAAEGCGESVELLEQISNRSCVISHEGQMTNLLKCIFLFYPFSVIFGHKNHEDCVEVTEKIKFINSCNQGLNINNFHKLSTE